MNMERLRVSDTEYPSLYKVAIMLMNESGPIEVMARGKQVSKALYMGANLMKEGLLEKWAVPLPTITVMDDGNDVLDITFIMFPNIERVKEKSAYLRTIPARGEESVR